MACFLVPTAEAIVTTVAAKAMEKKEEKTESCQVELGEEGIVEAEKIPFSQKLKWLNYMLWGGAVLLAFEHLWHGEVVPWFPFLTAAANPSDAAEMLHEMATVGVTMAVLITVIWFGMLLVVSAIEKRAVKSATRKAGA